jgi:hypothetical protein
LKPVGFSESIHFKLGPDCSEKSLKKDQQIFLIFTIENVINFNVLHTENQNEQIIFCFFKGLMHGLCLMDKALITI